MQTKQELKFSRLVYDSFLKYIMTLYQYREKKLVNKSLLSITQPQFATIPHHTIMNQQLASTPCIIHKQFLPGHCGHSNRQGANYNRHRKQYLLAQKLQHVCRGTCWMLQVARDNVFDSHKRGQQPYFVDVFVLENLKFRHQTEK